MSYFQQFIVRLSSGGVLYCFLGSMAQWLRELGPNPVQLPTSPGIDQLFCQELVIFWGRVYLVD